jgi:acetoin utilization protein AcuB
VINKLLKEVMTPNPITLNIDENFCQVANIFQERNIRHLPIVNNNGELFGVISQRDLYRIATPERGLDGEYIYDMGELGKLVVKNHIVHEPIALCEDDPLAKAMELMIEKKLGCIPITDQNKKVVGIITVIDALKILLGLIRKES